MGLLPEFVLQRVIVNGIRAVRQDLTFADQLFWNLPAESLQEVKNLITKQKINVIMQYPKADTVLPCVAIVLGREDETLPFVGDVMGSGVLPDEVFTIPEDSSNSVPTETSIDPELEGEPSRIFDEGKILEQTGGGYTAFYSLLIRSTNYYITVFLYHLMKAILITNRDLLEANGVQNMAISGSDVTVDSELLPDYLYSRNLDIKFLYFFDFYTKAPVVSSIDVKVIEPILDDCFEGDPNVVETEVTVTTDSPIK